MERRWYLIQCKPREAFRASEHLTRQEFEHFLPVVHREVVRRGRRDVIEEPLFPHYLFVRLSTVADNWAPLRSTRGVAKLVRFGDLPLAVPDDLVAALQEQQNQPDAPPEALFQPGDAVTLVEGPLAGLPAVCAERDGERRVVLLLTMLHQLQRVVVDVSQVRRRD